jgi:hypothetical protein
MVTQPNLCNQVLCCIILTEAICRDKSIALENFGPKVLTLVHSVFIQQYRSHNFLIQTVQ